MRDERTTSLHKALRGGAGSEGGAPLEARLQKRKTGSEVLERRAGEGVLEREAGGKTRIYEISMFERNTITHEVDQAMKETNELVAGKDVGGGDLVVGGSRAKGKCRKERCW